MERPVFVTSNEKKVAQLSLRLGVTLRHAALDLPEIQSLELAEVVAQKAKAAFELVGVPVLVEDTSLVFPALGRLPGPLIKWFLSELGCNGLCGLLDGDRERLAVASVLFGLYDGEALHTFDAAIKGRIAGVPRGEQSFGFDPIFIPDGFAKTWGEMDSDEQTETSMRRIALAKLRVFLNERGVS